MYVLCDNFLKHITNIMKRFVVLLAFTLLITSCDLEDFYENKGTYYYDASGDGYVYNYVTNEPIPYAKVCVRSMFKRSKITKSPIDDYYKADENGYFKVEFIRRIDSENVVSYEISPSVDGCTEVKKISVGKVKDEKSIIHLDTLKNTSCF